MKTVEGLLYTDEHNWLEIDDDIAYIGITDYGQEELEDIVYIDFPEVGEDLKVDELVFSIESVKATIDLFMEFSGEVVEINENLLDAPELVNDDPYENWIVKIEVKDRGNIDKLMNEDEYRKFLSTLD